VFSLGAWRAAKAAAYDELALSVIRRQLHMAAGCDAIDEYIEAITKAGEGLKGFKKASIEYTMVGLKFHRLIGESGNQEFDNFLKRAGAEMYADAFNQASDLLKKITLVTDEP
jgi:hypothetical protein